MINNKLMSPSSFVRRRLVGSHSCDEAAPSNTGEFDWPADTCCAATGNRCHVGLSEAINMTDKKPLSFDGQLERNKIQLATRASWNKKASEREKDRNDNNGNNNDTLSSVRLRANLH